jgi:hypothetical protein
VTLVKHLIISGERAILPGPRIDFEVEANGIHIAFAIPVEELERAEGACFQSNAEWIAAFERQKSVIQCAVWRLLVERRISPGRMLLRL